MGLMYKTYPISEIKEKLTYSDESGELLRLSGTSALVMGDKDGYLRVKLGGSFFKAHRVAWALFYGEWPDGEIDHINGDKADNRIYNLRVVSKADNQLNQPLNKHNSSGIMGVHWNTNRSAWYVRAQVSGRRKFIGSFKDFFEACCARKSAENKYGYFENHGRAV
jgi:hypothetical protein